MNAAPETVKPTEEQLAIEMGAALYRMARQAWATLRLADPTDNILTKGLYLNTLCDALRFASIHELDRIFDPESSEFSEKVGALESCARTQGIDIHL